ncbi:unnamed protein product [Effrenium voratum]|uniref:Uncharacterized protein n=1 Tax=Effrenium voratum TaxID=2562239 RepID=A0AA36IP24_9DINO|nr:unnamed protein product [Effrenium voratum]
MARDPSLVLAVEEVSSHYVFQTLASRCNIEALNCSSLSELMSFSAKDPVMVITDNIDWLQKLKGTSGTQGIFLIDATCSGWDWGCQHELLPSCSLEDFEQSLRHGARWLEQQA